MMETPMRTTADELTALEVAERTGRRLFLGWAERLPCVMCDTRTIYAAPNLAWTGEPCEEGCCTGPVMPTCAACTEDLPPDSRAELTNADKETNR